MKYTIVYDSPSRLRLRAGAGAFSKKQEDSLVRCLTGIDGVCSASFSSVNSGMLVYVKEGSRQNVLNAVSALSAKDLKERDLSGSRLIDEEFKKDLFIIVRKRILMKLFLPSFLSLPLTVWRAVPFVKQGLKSLSNGHLNVDVLDAVSISASILSGSPSAASTVMTLLNISSLLEGYTREKAKNALSDSLALNIDKVWKVEDGTEKQIPLSSVQIGDVIRVRQGSMIPIDGVVKDGSAGVNEASMTGESVPVLKTAGMTVYAGTVPEEGSLDIEVTKMPDDTRIHNIIELIENSSELKSGVQTNAERFADSLVPFSFLLSAATFAFTGNLTKALSVLMVDYSCAIKLSAPICVISAMKEATNYDIMIKGGRFLENYAFADTIVFDKTGTLTVSCPNLAKVVAYNGYTENEILKIAACLEEHFPHSVAKAIVHAASERHLEHREEHAEVEYIVAHGIASKLGNMRALIGSAHFVFDDEHVELSDEQKAEIAALGEKYSMIYLALGGALCGILCIEDPIRENAKEVIAALKQRGFTNVMVITGDGESTAKNVCKTLGIDTYHARVLPEDKLSIIQSIQAKNHKAVMVGDGINDSPALAAADVSVAMKDASDIARETADITLLSSDLERLVVLRDLSENPFSCIRSNYRFITVFNSSLLALGLLGVLSPVTGALLHNLSTMGICMKSMKPYLSKENENAVLNEEEVSVHHLRARE